MRNEHIKNELNNLPQDFDREALWKSIDVPKKKRKKRFMFWFLTVGVIILGALLLSTYHERAFRGKESMANLESPGLKMLKNDKNLHSDASKGEIEQTSTEPEISNNSGTRVGLESQTTLEKGTNSKHYSDVPAVKNFIEKQQAKDVEKEATNIKAREEGYPSGLTIASNIKEDSTIGEGATEIKVNREPISGEGVAQVGKSESNLRDEVNFENLNNTFRKKESVSRLPAVPFAMLSQNRILIAQKDLVIVEQSRMNKISGFGVSFIGLGGVAQHSILESNSVIHRAENEKALESISLSIAGSYISGNFDLFAGLSYIQHNTELGFSSSIRTFENSLQGPVLNNQETMYTLYNAYRHVDLISGVGYRIYVTDRWTIAPSVQVGYTLDFKSEGEIFKPENLTNYEVSEYTDPSKWQGQLNLKLSRRVSDNWEIGLMALISTSKTLHMEDSNSHSAAFKGVGINIFRKL